MPEAEVKIHFITSPWLLIQITSYLRARQAKTLVMSLWKVPDRQTQELMEDFYTRLLQGQPRAEALRAAQLAMKARHSDPFYWGAFICQGELVPLNQP